MFASLDVLLAAACKGLAELQVVSGGCPACTLAGIRRRRQQVGDTEDEYGRWTGANADAYYSLGAFNWKKSVAEFWKAHPREREY